MIISKGVQCLRVLLLWMVMLLSLLPQGFAAEQTVDESESFWDEWNAYVKELIRLDLETPDPWEPVNRKIYAFNDFADRNLLVPLSKGYHWITPDPVEKGIGNMFANLFEVTTIANDLLQLKLKQAASDTGRLVVNSTLGVVGLFDVASLMGLEKHQEDFGQTMGYWGVGPGPYIVVPLLGPYSMRDGLGGYVNTYTDYISNLDHVPTRNSFLAVRTVHNRASLLTAEELISGDRYSFIRDAYLQQREYLVKDGLVEDDFGDEDYDEGWQENWDE